MFKPFVQTLGIIAIGLAGSAAPAAPTTDSLTRLPLYSGMEFASTASQNVCGTKVQNATYSPSHGTLATVDRWYASHLRGFTIKHGTNRNYPYDVFINADSTMSVTILGSGPKTGVEGVVYHRNTKPATADNLVGWLDGSMVLCR